MSSIGRRPTKCRTLKIGNISIVKIIGRLTPDENDDVLLNTVKQLAEKGEIYFLIDLSGVNYINSTGIGSLIQTYRLAQSKGGDLKLLSPSQPVSHIIQVSKLDSIFKSYTDQEAAVASFAEDLSKPKALETVKKTRGRKASDQDEERNSEEE